MYLYINIYIIIYIHICMYIYIASVGRRRHLGQRASNLHETAADIRNAFTGVPRPQETALSPRTTIEP